MLRNPKSYIMEAIDGPKAQRAKFITNKFGSSWSGLPGFDNIDQFAEKVAEIDPTKKGIYMLWIATLALKRPDENRTEDFRRLKSDLEAFEKFKSKIEQKDINQYKSYSQLYKAIDPFLDKPPTPDEKARSREEARLAKIKDQITMVYKGAEGWIRIPETKQAAKFLGQGTRWCTAARMDNMYAHYSKTDKLFVVYDATTKQRYQLHLQSGQFADSADANQGFKSLPTWARPHIVDYYKTKVLGQGKNLSLKQMGALTGFGAEDLHKGTAHEELFDLMKKYGVA